MMALLEIIDLSASYEGKPALENIHFSLDKGKILCLLGPSGSGKTTLLRQLAGLDTPDKGTILFAGRDMANVVSHKRNFGMMFQEYALFPHKNVAENIGFGLEMQKWSLEKRQQRTKEMLTLVGLGGFENRTVGELSGGEQQRVALARSLAPKPQLLLLDEPLGSLDRILRDRLAGEIRAILKSQGITAVFVTHDQSEAFAVADKIAILQQGHLEQFDTPESVYRNPASVNAARFLGFHNILDFSRAEPLEIHALFSNIPRKLFLQTTEQLLIRPEAAAILTKSSNSENYPLLEGKIVKRQFQGNLYLVTVEKEGVRFLFSLPIDPQPPETGERITLAINPAAMVLLKKKGEG